MRKNILLLGTVFLLIAACIPQMAEPISTATLAPETPTFTETPSPRLPSQTATFTPPPTATPVPHPMSIIALRNGKYPGSEITIVRELERGTNYRRYYAYYFSEGLKIYALLTIPNGTPPEGGFPAILFNHGYIPPASYRTTERYVAYVDGFGNTDSLAEFIAWTGYEQHGLCCNPLFVSYLTSNYSLTAASPAIDAGLPLGDPFLGAAPDLGRFEFIP